MCQEPDLVHAVHDEYIAACAREIEKNTFVANAIGEQNICEWRSSQGVWPLLNARQAEFLHHEVPGIIVSDSLRAELARAG